MRTQTDKPVGRVTELPATEVHIDTVKSIYAAFLRGDVSYVLACLANDVDWEYGTGANHVPWLKHRHGIPGASQYFESVGELQILSTTFKHYMADGDVVCVLLDWEARVKRNGRVIHEEDQVHIWTFNAADRVCRFRHALDTLKHEYAWLDVH